MIPGGVYTCHTRTPKAESELAQFTAVCRDPSSALPSPGTGGNPCQLAPSQRAQQGPAPQSLALGREGSEASSGRGTPGSWRLLSRLQAGVPTVPGPSQSHAREVQNSPLVPSGKARRPFYKWEAEAQKKKALTKVIQPLTRVELCQAKNTVLRTGLKTTEPYAGPQHDIRPLTYMIPFNLTHTTSERSS